jgi:hypothetical protein
MYCILPTSAAEAVPIKRAILLGITILVPFCSLGLCQTQTCSLLNTPVTFPQMCAILISQIQDIYFFPLTFQGYFDVF